MYFGYSFEMGIFKKKQTSILIINRESLILPTSLQTVDRRTDNVIYRAATLQKMKYRLSKEAYLIDESNVNMNQGNMDVARVMEDNSFPFNHNLK